MATPSDHYEEAERLLDRSRTLTEEWAVKAAKAEETISTVTNVKLLHLEILSRMLSDRAKIHATLATANYVAKTGPIEMPAMTAGSNNGNPSCIDIELPK